MKTNFTTQTAIRATVLIFVISIAFSPLIKAQGTKKGNQKEEKFQQPEAPKPVEGKFTTIANDIPKIVKETPYKPVPLAPHAPVYKNTGSAWDNDNYGNAKQEWIKNYPEEYQKLNDDAAKYADKPSVTKTDYNADFINEMEPVVKKDAPEVKPPAVSPEVKETTPIYLNTSKLTPDEIQELVNKNNKLKEQNNQNNNQ